MNALITAVLLAFFTLTASSCCTSHLQSAPQCHPCEASACFPSCEENCYPRTPEMQGYTYLHAGSYDPYCVCNCCPLRYCPCKPKACLRPNAGGYHPIGCCNDCF